jgi:hypothetical protein
MRRRILTAAVAFGFFSSQAQAAFVGSPAQYSVVTGGAADQLNAVAPGTAGIPLTSTGSSSQPTFSVCTVVGGCTGLATITAHTLLIGNGTSNPNLTTATAGAVLTETTTSADPAFTVTPTLGVAGTSAGTLTLANAAAAFSVTIQEAGTAASSYNFNLPLTAGSSGNVLASGGGGSAPMTWVTAGVGITEAAVSGSGATQTLATTNQLTTVSNITVAAVWSLPAIQANGYRQCLKDGTTNFATHNQTVEPNPTSLTIDGVAGTSGIVLNQAHQEACFLSDGTNWFIE